MEYRKGIGRLKRYMAGLSLTVTVSLFAFSGAFAGPLEDCKEFALYGVPSTKGDLLCRTGYLLAHDPERKTPIWVIEHLTVSRWPYRTN